MNNQQQQQLPPVQPGGHPPQQQQRQQHQPVQLGGPPPQMQPGGPNQGGNLQQHGALSLPEVSTTHLPEVLTSPGASISRLPTLAAPLLLEATTSPTSLLISEEEE